MSGAAEKIAVVIVTYNRPELLGELLESAAALHDAPWRIIVVDNASTDHTQQVIETATSRFAEGVLVNHHMDVNTGGAGGFSEGTRVAVELGAEWIWLMDDDVEILPEALERFAPWMQRFRVLHGRRYDFDGTPFFWQARFQNWLGIPLPYRRNAFNRDGYAITNSGTFEGMMVHADVVRQIGLPDPRFFISWDDAVYAWVASHVTDVVYVDIYVLKRKRQQRQINLGIRHLNDSSDLARYHVMRNRAYVARYFQQYGELSRVGFALGTTLTYFKELLRLVAVERSLKGAKALHRGIRDSRALRRDPQWKPMPPFEPAHTEKA